MRELAKLHTGLGGGNVAVVDTVNVDGNEHYKQSFWGIGAGIEALRSGKAFHVLSFDGTFSKQAVEFFKKVLCSCTFADLQGDYMVRDFNHGWPQLAAACVLSLLCRRLVTLARTQESLKLSSGRTRRL